ncbi:MAG: hybrid sensor histidine kinase/response regulator [Bacteroidota bacterium]
MKEQKQKILIVDDEPDLRNVIREILTDAGYDVSDAENGTQGLILAKTGLPDLILCDIQMPEMNGYELLNAVNLQSELKKIPFVFMTGVNTGQYDVRKGMDLGADDYLTKPFTTEELIAAVQTRLRKKQAWEKYFNTNIENTRVGFVVLLSNELNLLVMDILEHAQSILNEQEGTNPVIRNAAQMIGRSGKRLSHLHENILLYAMLQVWVNDDEKITAFRQESMDSYLTVLQSIVGENVRAKNRQDSFEFDCTDSALQISPPDFGKIVDEVIDNACKFSAQDSRIHISSKSAATMIHLTFRDEGRGMQAEEIAGVESLLQNRSEPHNRQESGLGLTIAKTLTELYGGNLSIQSSEQSGTIVTVTLPKAVAH